MIRLDVNASGEIIKQKCEEAKLTPKQLQEALGVTVTAPYVWLTGKGLPKVETLLNLAEMLDCQITELLMVQSDDGVEPISLSEYYISKLTVNDAVELVAKADSVIAELSADDYFE